MPASFSVVVAVCPNPTKLAIDNWVVVKDPKDVVADWPANNAGVIFSIVKEPKAVDAETPVNKWIGLDEIVIAPIAVCADTPVIPITSAGDIFPTVLVADKAGRPIEWSSTDNNPGLDVKLNADSVSETSDLALKDPIALWADRPVNPSATSSGVNTPTVVVADRPVKLNTAESTVPQPFSPQSKVPQPGCTFIKLVGIFKDVVAVKPGRITSIADSPQFSKPHVSEPQPVSLKDSTDPSVDVIDKPVRETLTSVWSP